jgi:hypothetical protein
MAHFWLADGDASLNCCAPFFFGHRRLGMLVTGVDPLGRCSVQIGSPTMFSQTAKTPPSRRCFLTADVDFWWFVAEWSQTDGLAAGYISDHGFTRGDLRQHGDRG